MKQEVIEKKGPLYAARKSSLITQQEMAETLGISAPTMLGYEKEPESTPIGTLAEIYRNVEDDGKKIIEGYMTDLFRPKLVV